MKKRKTFLALLLAASFLLPQVTAAAIEESPLPETNNSKREYNTELIPYTGPLVAEDEPMLTAEIEEQRFSGDSYDAPRLSGKAFGNVTEDTEGIQTFAATSADDASEYHTLKEPSFRNNIKEPYMSGRSATAYVSPYSGDLQLNYTDISLPGKNGLDLNLTRFYQSNQGHVVRENSPIDNSISQDPTTYYNERYALGLGWSFGFPSVEIKKTREWDSTYDGELYYHDGTGSVYRVNSKDMLGTDIDEDGNFVSNGYLLYTTNLDNYYTDNVKFRDVDHSYSRDGVESQFSFRDADGTMQYFGRQGQLLAMVDRFGNEIKFDYTDMPGENLTHYDSYQDFVKTGNMTDERTYMYFENGSSTISTGSFSSKYVSADSEVDTYTLGFDYYAGETVTNFSGTLKVYVDVRGSQNAPLASEPLATITPTTQRETVTEIMQFTLDRSAYSETPRSLRLRVVVEQGKGRIQFNNVRLQPHKPLLSKITDTLGRTLEFTYNGDLYQRYEGSPYQTMVVSVKDPDGTIFREFLYRRAPADFCIKDIEGNVYATGWYYMLFSCEVYGAGREIHGIEAREYEQIIEYITEDGSASSYHHNESTQQGYNYDGRPLVSRIGHRNSDTYFAYESTKKVVGSSIDTPREYAGYETAFRVVETYDVNHAALAVENTNPQINRTTYNYKAGKYKDETGYSIPSSYGTVYGLDPEVGTYVVTVTNPSGSVDTYTYTKHTFATGNKRKFQIKLNLPDKQTTAESTQTGADNIVTEMLYESDYNINSPTQTTVTETIGGTTRKYITRTEYDENSCLPVKTSLPLTETEAETPGIPAQKAVTTTYQNIGNRVFLPKTNSYYQSALVQCAESVEYDSLGRVLNTTDAEGNKVYLEYDSTYPWLPSRVYYEDPENRGQQERIAEILYDNTGGYGIGPTKVRTKYQDGQYAEQQMTYELQYGNVATQTDANGAVTRYTYDVFGRPKSIVSPSYQADGGLSYLLQQYTYFNKADYGENSYGYMRVANIEMEEPDATTGNTVSYEEAYYDDYGYMVYYKDNVGSYRYFYDNANRPIAAQDPRDYGTTAYTQEVTYDGWGRTVTATDRMGNVQKADYKSQRTDYSFTPAGSTTAENHYSELADIYGNVVEVRSYPNGMSESSYISQQYTYDLAGNVTQATDANGNSTTYTYDKLNQAVQVTQADGSVVETTYTKFGTPLEIKQTDDGEDYTIAAAYDDRGLQISMEQKGKNIATRPWNYTYGADGRLLSMEDPSGGVRNYGYDETGNTTDYQNGGEQREITFNYLGQQTHVVKNENGRVQRNVYFEYSEQGWLLEKRTTGLSGGTLEKVNYQYNQVGSVEKVIPADGEERAYTRDTLERTTQISMEDGKNFSYEYYADGAIKAVIYPGGSIRTDYAYDNANRLATIVTKKGSTVLYQAAYTYDSNGNILTVTGTDPVTYTYDSMNQLASETRNGVTTTYEYDNRGNLVKETKGAEVTNYTYTGDNRLTQVDKNGTITTYEYDLNGNLVGDSNGSFYGYDEENRLVYAKVDGVVSEYGISTEGLRVSKGVGNDYTYEESTAYTIDQDGNVILENGDDIIRGHQALAKRTEDGSYYYYIYNGHGDVVMLVDESGNVKNSYQYDAWGKITNETETIPNSIKYAGEYYDAETGFLYLRNRMYDPTTRRFTSEDPARDQLNWYIYCGNNPVMFVDPWGLRNVVVVVGEDAASNNNTFNSNADTFIRDNPNDTIVKLYAWNYSSQEELIEAIGNAFGDAGLDALVIESHASSYSLIVSSRYTISRKADWSKVKFNADANIRLTGCNSGGRDGEKSISSIAQYISNATWTTVWAYTNNTSQKSMYGGTYQKPVRMYSGQKVEEYYTVFKPIYGPLPY